MEFALKTLIVLVLAVVALAVFIFMLSSSAGTGTSAIDGLLNFFKGILPGEGTEPPANPADGGTNPADDSSDDTEISDLVPKG